MNLDSTNATEEDLPAKLRRVWLSVQFQSQPDTRGLLHEAADEIERLRELEAKWKPIVSRAVGIFNQQEQHRDFVPSIWAQRVAEYIVNGGDRA